MTWGAHLCFYTHDSQLSRLVYQHQHVPQSPSCPSVVATVQQSWGRLWREKSFQYQGRWRANKEKAPCRYVVGRHHHLCFSIGPQIDSSKEIWPELSTAGQKRWLLLTSDASPGAWWRPLNQSDEWEQSLTRHQSTTGTICWRTTRTCWGLCHNTPSSADCELVGGNFLSSRSQMWSCTSKLLFCVWNLVATLWPGGGGRHRYLSMMPLQSLPADKEVAKYCCADNLYASYANALHKITWLFVYFDANGYSPTWGPGITCRSSCRDTCAPLVLTCTTLLCTTVPMAPAHSLGPSPLKRPTLPSILIMCFAEHWHHEGEKHRMDLYIFMQVT